MGHILTTVRTETLRGAFSKTIAIETNDPTQPKVSVVVRADVVESVNFLPDRIVLRNALHSTPSAEILVRKDPTESGKLQIKDVETSAPWLLAGVREVESPLPAEGDRPARLPGDYVLEVHIGDSPASAGRSQQSVSFKTGLPRQPVATVPVIVMFTPLVELSPERLVLPTEAAEETVSVFLRRGADPTLLRVEARPETLKVELEPLGHRAFKLHVHWEGGPESDLGITFRLGQESHELPVEWKAKDPQT